LGLLHFAAGFFSPGQKKMVYFNVDQNDATRFGERMLQPTNAMIFLTVDVS